MKITQIKDVLSSITLAPSKWELDTIVWHDRLSNPATLANFLTRIQVLQSTKKQNTPALQQELAHLVAMLDEIDDADIADLVNQSEEDAKDAFIEELAKVSAIEVITGGKLSFNTMNTACKLSPNDFILSAKRTQDLLNSIQGLVIKGETLSKDVAGA
jgi:hypothetical protein